MNGSHQRTLERALGIVASKERLAAALEVPMNELDGYLSGEKPFPQKLFFLALDIVADKPQEE